MTRLNTGFSGISDDEFYHLAVLIAQKVNGIAVFASLKGQLPPITAGAETLQSAMNQPAGPVREAAVKAARGSLSALLTNLANALMITPGATDTDLAASGYTLAAKPTHTSAPPDAPSNLRLKTTGVSGELTVLFDKVDRAVMYDVETTLDPVAGPWADAGSYNSTRGIKLTGLTRGKDYFVHVRAIAAGQNAGAWSDLASAMVI